MTLPATLSITSASVALLAALLAFGMSSAPGWRELRCFAVCASFAALFNLVNVPITLNVGTGTLLVVSRLSLLFAGLHAATWFKYTATHENRAMSGGEKIWVAIGLALASTSVIPGVLVEDRIVPRPVELLHVTYADAPPTKLGLVAVVHYVTSIALLFVRAVRRRLAGDVRATTQAVALGAVVIGGVHDGLATADIIRSPYILDLSVLVLVLAVGGSITSRFVASARELEAAHQELVKKERLAALGELAAVVAHEVRNPLAVVFNATAGLRRTTPGSPDHDSLLAIVQEEAERLRDIVSELLEFARPRLPVLGTACIDDIVRSAVDTARSVVGAGIKDVLVDSKADAGRVTCDDRLVHQAVVNLVTNALQTSGRRGPVRVDICEDPVRQTISVQVADDGNGVPREIRERIFTPFFSTRPKGTGLGLTVVRRCADAHGGDIVLRPTPGGGATFELYLPRRAE